LPTGGEGPRLLRPLLCLTREQTLAYCAAARVTPLDDETNLSPRFRRNRIRHEVLPLLRELNPGMDAALVRLADAAAEDAAYLSAMAAGGLLPAREGAQGLALKVLRGWPASLRHRALRLAYATAAGDARDLTQRHVQALDRLVLGGHTGDRLDLPRSVTALLRREALELNRKAPDAAKLPGESIPLVIPGEARFGALAVAAAAGHPDAGTAAEVDAGVLAGALLVRRRRPGDRFQPLGMSETKKLQDFFTDAHVPRDQRDAIPLFVTPRGIAWVGGLRVAEWARPRPGLPTVFLSYRPD
jgi:tRNA(Ile)-lysidine synthase